MGDNRHDHTHIMQQVFNLHILHDDDDDDDDDDGGIKIAQEVNFF